MSLIKLALTEQPNWANRHPMLSSGIALAGGIAAADMGVNLYKYKINPLKSGFNSAKQALVHGAKEGGLYGGILAAAEPAILHGGLRKKREPNE